MPASLEVDLALIQASLLLSCKRNLLALENLDLQDQGSQVSIKSRSPPASLPFRQRPGRWADNCKMIYFSRALAIACLSHKGEKSVQRKTLKVLPSCKQVCRLSWENRLAVVRGKPTIIVRKTQQVQFTQSNFLTDKTLSSLIFSPVLRSLQQRETTSSIDERRNQVSKRALITLWIQNSPFHRKNSNVPTKFTLFLRR